MRNTATLGCLFILLLQSQAIATDKLVRGVGIDGIVVGESTAGQLSAKCTNGELVKHGRYSYEYKCGDGLSFYYHQDDPEEVLVLVKVTCSSKRETRGGIRCCTSTFQDVVDKYGPGYVISYIYSGDEVEVEYPGIAFRTPSAEFHRKEGDAVVREISVREVKDQDPLAYDRGRTTLQRLFSFRGEGKFSLAINYEGVTPSGVESDLVFVSDDGSYYVSEFKSLMTLEGVSMQELMSKGEGFFSSRFFAKGAFFEDRLFIRYLERLSATQ
jgi:hypothetical protein